MTNMNWTQERLRIVYWLETLAGLTLSTLFLIWFFVGIGGPWHWFGIGLLGLILSGWYVKEGTISVPQEQRRCMECLGAFMYALGPGLHWVPPISSRVRATVYVAEQRLSLFNKESIFIDFQDGSAQPKGSCAFIQMHEDQRADLGENSGTYKMTYAVTKVMEAVRSLLENSTRSYLNGMTIEQGIQLGRAGYDIVDRMRNHANEDIRGQVRTIEQTLEGWGLQLHRITIGDFDLSEAVKKEREEVHKAMQQVAVMSHHVNQRSGEISGIIIKTIANVTGRTQAATKQFIRDNPELSAQVMAFTQDMISRDWSLGKGALTDIRVSGGGTGGDLLLQLIAAFRQVAARGGQE